MSGIYLVNNSESNPPFLPPTQWKGKNISLLLERTVSLGIAGALAGLVIGGPLGALAGLVAGVALGALSYFAEYFYHRPSSMVEQSQIPLTSEKEEDCTKIDTVIPIATLSQALSSLAKEPNQMDDRDLFFIEEAVAYASDPRYKDILPKEQVQDILEGAEKLWKSELAKEAKKLTEPSSNEDRFKLARDAIQSHPRFKYCEKEIQESLTFRLYTSTSFQKLFEGKEFNYFESSLTHSMDLPIHYPSRTKALEWILSCEAIEPSASFAQMDSPAMKVYQAIKDLPLEFLTEEEKAIKSFGDKMYAPYAPLNDAKYNSMAERVLQISKEDGRDPIDIRTMFSNFKAPQNLPSEIIDSIAEIMKNKELLIEETAFCKYLKNNLFNLNLVIKQILPYMLNGSATQQQTGMGLLGIAIKQFMDKHNESEQQSISNAWNCFRFVLSEEVN